MPLATSSRSRYDPPCRCDRAPFACAKHRRLRPGQALYMVAGEAPRFGKPLIEPTVEALPRMAAFAAFDEPGWGALTLPDGREAKLLVGATGFILRLDKLAHDRSPLPSLPGYVREVFRERWAEWGEVGVIYRWPEGNDELLAVTARDLRPHAPGAIDLLAAVLMHDYAREALG